MRDSASATPSLHPAYLINKLNNYVKELNIILPNGTNIGGRSKKILLILGRNMNFII